MRFRKHRAKRLSLDITPLIDVIFLLLIFFMVSTTFISSSGINVDLPAASLKPKPEKPDSLEIIITPKRKIFLNGNLVEESRLYQTLREILSETKQDALIIRADGKTEHQLVVTVMDIAKQAGIKEMAIATKYKEHQDTIAD